MKKAKESPAAPTSGPLKIRIGGKEREFDIENPVLPDWVEDNKLTAGGYPYDKKMKSDEYDEILEKLQIELVKAQAWLQSTGKRVMALFEGRDAAGKGGTIFVVRQYLNPRTARNVALTKPTPTELGQWYYQRYVDHFPTSGEFVTFDRSWYNRAGVEPVMGFCTPQQHEQFLDETPHFERMISNEGIHFFKFWLNIGRETQLERFHDRRYSPLKSWKFSPIDVAGITKWDDYTKVRDTMFERTHKEFAPWIIVRANDKRRARLAIMRRILSSLPYEGRDLEIIGKEDKKIIGEGPSFLGKQD
ncbi:MULTISPECIES: polyphosphate kinase 2 [unclassified Mesorhizobium]|jgi:polyphosphate kinase 2|uniref:polyphosphate kinase 2 n=1 Tax=unclassified Mesorhizobium TaxID=325217 RepID=UPI000FD36827|nr:MULTISPECIES: polyphosphate kinase 2 [unclassified Mesorhizobium]AZV17988.1 polyphosphate kinase 2 [Mesorhizobium sp. M7A.F.Ce.TU.012.03.2.1]RUU92918.1 polyphosphate kinase 2 [Mesorhizobium sp. M7A.F.Ca.MR.176.00.0.0]RVD13926.1 polyphosphate kinase 2 [Mesorhizobium sp. M7A.F.Ca.ET.027.02.1.1]RWD04331.1 MAG: polyphosphate kinase 2 [Mesorhizobium sp.]RWO88823.1 MAG: polyphosphate kinase 2 [Mesorhizobium sp.]